MPAQDYESLPNSVLAWKKNQKLGRFDPNAPDIEQQKIKALEREIEERGTLHIAVISGDHSTRLRGAGVERR